MNDKKPIDGEISETQNLDELPVVKAAETWLDADTGVVETFLKRRSDNRRQLLTWISKNLAEDSDYGVIKGKKSLWKPGAEKIAGMLGLQVRWPDLHQELDRLRQGADTVFLSCELLRDHVVQAQGAGARSIKQDAGDWNKAIKMCKKSAMIDAVLNVGGLSEVFTQDLDSLDDEPAEPLTEEHQTDLQAKAEELFGTDKTMRILTRMASQYFRIKDGDWRKIPEYRYLDAIRILEEKAQS